MNALRIISSDPLSRGPQMSSGIEGIVGASHASQAKEYRPEGVWVQNLVEKSRKDP